MSLEGSLETIALPEVLQLLSETSKSGELLVRGDRGEGKLWFETGRLSGFEVARCSNPADALFELLRQASGRFSFDAGTERPESASAVGEDGGEEVSPILEVAQAHLEEWAGIVAVVPSLDHAVSLASDAPSDEVTLSAAQWSLVVTIGEGRTVATVLDLAGLSEFEGCRSLKTLVEAGLASVAEPEVVAEPEPVVEEPVLEVEPLVSEDVDEPEGVEEPEATDEPSPEFGSLSAALASFEVESEPAEVAPAYEEPQVVVNSGEFDGHDFVFKAPAQSEVDGYEPQPVPYPEAHDNGVYDAEADDHGTMASRAALEALLAEIPGDDGAETPAGHGDNGEVHDGLADRGPWTSQELASFDQMGGWHGDESLAAAPEGAQEFDFSHVGDHTEPASASASEYRFEESHDSYAEATGEESESADGDGASAEEEPEEAQPEHVNRGLLLKFLSSVRS